MNKASKSGFGIAIFTSAFLLAIPGLASQKNNTRTHDVGFIMFNSYGNGLRLTGNESYEPVLVQSAESLMTRYNPNVGATRSWDFGTWSYPVIIDNMMNLELLYAATQMSEDQKFADAALNYADYYYLEALLRCKNL